MIDFVKESKEDLEKFIEHFPEKSDRILQLLKGHLLLEELLREILEIQLPHPDALNGNKGTNFNCHQVICLVEAITPQSQVMPWIWVAAKKLNNIRNDLAHKLSPDGLDNKILDLINYANSESPEIQQEVEKLEVEETDKLIEVLISMCSCLSSLKTILKNNV